ncbi:MAG: lytic murein transglycosylase [Actinobacteria bacterium]|nr:lytic murein transglycosylase [Actinomycetota bacterium]
MTVQHAVVLLLALLVALGLATSSRGDSAGAMGNAMGNRNRAAPAALTAIPPGSAQRPDWASGLDAMKDGQRPPPVAAASPPASPPTASASSLAADGIPATALDAYKRAGASVARTDPGCGLPWSLLAAIGRVESDHGRFHGSVLLVDGTSVPPVIGIALDGTRSALVADTDHGRLDGDPIYDHAIGPMQFIPATWARYGADGNGDGRADAFNIYDAALAAGRYLCLAGGVLTDEPGMARAVFAYNHVASYVSEVLALQLAYAGGVAAVLPPMTSPPVSLAPSASAIPPATSAPSTPPAGARASAPTTPSGSAVAPPSCSNSVAASSSPNGRGPSTGSNAASTPDSAGPSATSADPPTGPTGPSADPSASGSVLPGSNAGAAPRCS